MDQPELNPSIIGVGIDLADVARIDSMLKKYGDAFLEKTFAECEILYCKKRAFPAMHFAARFAAKEAAVYCDMQDFFSMQIDDVLRITSIPKSFVLLHPLNHNHYKTLQQKLYWNSMPSAGAEEKQ